MAVALSKRLIEAAEEARAANEARTPEENRRVAKFIREGAPGLKTDGQRDVAGRMAKEFEARADAGQQSGSSPAA